MPATTEARAERAGQLERFRAQAFAARASFSRRRLWNASLMVVALAVTDIYGVFLGAGPARYGLVLLPLFLVGVARSPSDRLTVANPSLSDFPLGALFVFGLLGSIYGLLFNHPQSPALAIFVPMSLALLHLTALGSLTEGEAWTNMRRLTGLLAIAVGIQAASALGLLRFIGGGGANPAASAAGAVFGHEKAFLLCAALTAAWLSGRRGLVVALAVLSLVAFVAYPAATYLVAAAVTVMTLVATGPRSTRARAYSLGLLCVALLVMVVVEVTSAGPATRSTLSSSYFKAVGKSDNSRPRTELWSKAWNELWHSPIVGSGFAGNTSLEVVLDGKRRQVPPHNDFLQMGMGGGLIGMGLLVAWVTTTNVVASGRLRALAGAGGLHRSRLLRTLLVGFNAFFAVALLNPVMSRGGLVALAMIFYSLLLTVGGDPAPAPEHGRR